MQPISNPAVAAVFEAYSAPMRDRLLCLRQLIFDTASDIDGVGELEETLKWGEPAYVTSRSKSGSTIRIDRKKSKDTQYAMYFHCQTRLVDTFRTLFPSEFKYEGNRSIIFDVSDEIPVEALRICIGMALTYHLHRRPRRREMARKEVIRPAERRGVTVGSKPKQGTDEK